MGAEIKAFLLRNLLWIILIAVIIFLFSLVFYSRRKIIKIYDKYLKIKVKSEIQGGAFAQFLLAQLNLNNVSLAQNPEKHIDAYIPSKKQIIMSSAVCNEASITSLAIVAHETGHAVQHTKGSFLFNLSHVMRAITNFTNKFIFPLLIMSFFFWIFKWPNKGDWLTVLIVSGVLFITNIFAKFTQIPLERDASKKAINYLTSYAEMTQEELKLCKKLLKVAGTTYIAHLFDDFIIFGGKIKKYLYKTYS